MPFGYGPFTFDEAGIGSTVESGGGVYGLAKPSASTLGRYTILYVGKTGNLRERLRTHPNRDEDVQDLVPGWLHERLDQEDAIQQATGKKSAKQK